MANEELANMETETKLSCCGKSICGGCVHSFHKSGGVRNCPFCKTNRIGTTGADHVEELMKRVKANDAGATYVLAGWYHHGGHDGLQQDQDKAKELLHFPKQSNSPSAREISQTQWEITHSLRHLLL
jgi:hypothetical protein